MMTTSGCREARGAASVHRRDVLPSRIQSRRADRQRRTTLHDAVHLPGSVLLAWILFAIRCKSFERAGLQADYLGGGRLSREFRIGEDWILWAVAEIGRSASLNGLLSDIVCTASKLRPVGMPLDTRETLEAQDLADRFSGAKSLAAQFYAYGGAWRALASRNLGAARRLRQLRWAGRLALPTTTGIQGGLAH